MSHAVKQPIRAELQIIIHDPSLTFLRLIDNFIQRTNPRVVNGHVKQLLENFCPLPKSHTFNVYIREQFKILYHSMAPLNIICNETSIYKNRKHNTTGLRRVDPTVVLL